MTKRDVQIAIAHARATGRHSLAKSLEFCWRDVLEQPDPPKPRIEASPINQVEFDWSDVRLNQGPID